MPEFRWSLDGGTTWTYEDQPLPYVLPVTAGQYPLVQGIGGAVLAGDYVAAPTAPAISPLAQSSAVPMHARRVADGGYSWHINDSAKYDPVRQQLYAANQSMVTGAQSIDVYGTSGVHQSRIVVNDNVATGFAPDDHNAPAITIFDGRLYVAYAGHNDDNFVYVRVSSDTTPENLGPDVALDLGASATYAQFTEVNGTLFVVGRAGPPEWRMFRLDGVNWIDAGLISVSTSQTYINLRSGGGFLRYIAWDHPTNSDPPSLVNRGKIKARQFSDGDPAGVLGDLPDIYVPSSGKSTRVLSVSPDASALAFCEFTSGSTTGQTYHILRWSGSGSFTDPAEWTREDIGANDYSFYASSNYVPGATLANVEGTAVWVCEAGPTGATTVKYGTRDVNGTWSFETRANSATPLARPVCDPMAEGMAIIQRLEAYINFRNASIDNYPIFVGDNILPGDFTAPPPSVTGVRGSQIFEYFDAPDLQTWDNTVDLSSAQDGDLLVAAFVYRSAGASDLTLGGHPFTKRPGANVSGSGNRMYVSTLRYSSGMGDQLRLHVQTGAAGYQKLMLAIVQPEFDFVGAGVSPSYQPGDLLAGLCWTAGGSGVTHDYSPDVRASVAAHGTSGTTVISFGLGPAPDAGNVAVSGLGGAASQLQLHAVLRPTP